MAVTAAIAAVGVGMTAVQSHQQKIAERKQQDSLEFAKEKQDKLAAEAKKKEAAAMNEAFAQSAANRKRQTTGANLPGAAPAQPLGAIGGAAAASKTLIGS